MDQDKQHHLLGIPIDGRAQDALEHIIAGYLAGTSFRRIATVNPEFLVLANGDPDFRRCLLSADIRVADGSGIVLAGLLSGFGVSRYPGADLMGFVLAEAERENLSVYLAVNREGLSSYSEVGDAIRAAYPDLSVSGRDLDRKNRAIPADIRDANLVLCNFGAPEQEQFLESLRETPGNIRLAMGIGGSFDFLTGKATRAPVWMRTLGLEWLNRLVRQPGRAGRIWSATIIFPFLCLSDRISSDRKSNASKASGRK